MKVKGESENVGLKLKIQKTKIMASSPITSCQIHGETVTDFTFGGLQITADGDCSHEIKRHSLLGRKAMINLDSILKSRDIEKQRHCFAYKGLYSQRHGFSSSHVWIWELNHKENWALKNWCFKLWCSRTAHWRQCPLNGKEIKEINPKQINLNIHCK